MEARKPPPLSPARQGSPLSPARQGSPLLLALEETVVADFVCTPAVYGIEGGMVAFVGKSRCVVWDVSTPSHCRMISSMPLAPISTTTNVLRVSESTICVAQRTNTLILLSLWDFYAHKVIRRVEITQVDRGYTGSQFICNVARGWMLVLPTKRGPLELRRASDLSLHAQIHLSLDGITHVTFFMMVNPSMLALIDGEKALHLFSMPSGAFMYSIDLPAVPVRLWLLSHQVIGVTMKHSTTMALVNVCDGTATLLPFRPGDRYQLINESQIVMWITSPASGRTSLTLRNIASPQIPVQYIHYHHQNDDLTSVMTISPNRWLTMINGSTGFRIYTLRPGGGGGEETNTNTWGELLGDPGCVPVRYSVAPDKVVMNYTRNHAAFAVVRENLVANIAATHSYALNGYLGLMPHLLAKVESFI